MKNTQLTTMVPIPVSDTKGLNDAISQANQLASVDSLTINIQGDFTLTEDILPINTAGTLNITLQNDNIINIDGAGRYRGFVILNGTVKLESLNIQNMLSSGAPGCMGAGAGVFVAHTSSYSPKVVTLSNTSFTGCIAKGGNVFLEVDKPDCPGRGGWGGGVSYDGDDGGAGNPGLNPSGNNIFGGAATAGDFGIIGPGGNGGSGGGHNDDGGERGDDGSPGGNSGYGAGSSAGGGAGGGGGGRNGNHRIYYHTWDATPGGPGGTGGSGGAAGFGGGQGAGPGNGEKGHPPEGENGGPGGFGGQGAIAGGGAGFGGAIFAMGSADITFKGSGTITGCQAIGGTSSTSHGDTSINGSSAGSGIFLHGSSTLKFSLPNNKDIYTIQDDIVDEAGAVRSGKAAKVTGSTGPDGLSTGGGDGVWDIEQGGGGRLVINGQNLLSGNMTIEGTLDLSNCGDISGSNSFNSLTLNNGGELLLTPASAVTGLKVKKLSLSANATMHLNGNSRIVAENVDFPDEFSITLESTGFESVLPGKPIEVITWSQPISSIPTIKVNSGDKCSVSVDKNSISITKH